MTVAELLEAARAETGLNDFGEDTFREGLDVYIRALRTEAKLNAAGEGAHRHNILKYLKQRLQVEDWYRRHPEIDDEPITAPLVELGLPRTGSTALSNLLAQDPNTRFLRAWEAGEPCPPPSTVKGPDPRLVKALAGNPEEPLKSVHAISSATGPMECQELMALDFKCFMFPAMAQVPSYQDWLLDADLTPTYRYEKRVLKLLQWGTPRKAWRLKCPNHLINLRAFDSVFPDARYVMTHRDPTDVMLSAAKIYSEVAARFTDNLDPRIMADINVKIWSVGMKRAIAYRDTHADARFYDIDFRAMQRDPVGEVRGLYKWMGEPITPEFESGMATWWKVNSANREPSDRPDPAKFGLDLDRVRPLFADYVARAKVWTTHS